MKKILTVAFLLIVIVSYSQQYTNNPAWGVGVKRFVITEGDTVGTKLGVTIISGVLYVANGTKWTPVGTGGSSLPPQTGNNGKYLKTNGTSASWQLANLLDSIDYTNAGTATVLRVKPGGSGLYKYEFALGGGINTLSVSDPLKTTGTSTPTLSIDTVTRPEGLFTLGKWAKDSAAIITSIASKSGKVYAGNGLTNVNDSTLRTDTSTAIVGTATVGYALNLYNILDGLKLSKSDTAAMLSKYRDSLNSHNSRIITNTQNIATNTASIATKEPSITASNTTLKYWNGYKNFVPLNKDSVGLSNVPNTDATNASNITSGTLPDARLSSNVPLLNNNNTFRYVGTAPLAGGTFFGQKTNNYVTGGLSYNSGSHILVGNYFYDTIKFNGHNQTAYGVQISPTFINSGGYAETDRKALVVDGNTLINGNLQLTGTLTFPGVLSASSFDATTSFRLSGTNVVNRYWSNTMLSIGFPVTGTIIQNTSNGNHILYASNASNSIAIGQGTGYPTAAPANGLGVVGSIGAGTLSPNSTLSTAGSFSTAFSSKTTTYTATASDYTITADATSAAFSITLPTAVGINGRIYVIKKVDASGNAVTVATTSSQTIDDNTTYSLSSQYKYVMVQSNGSNWIIIGNN